MGEGSEVSRSAEAKLIERIMPPVKWRRLLQLPRYAFVAAATADTGTDTDTRVSRGGAGRGGAH